MFYHFIVEYKAGAELKSLYKYDMQDKEYILEVITQPLNNERIQIDGYFINPYQIERIIVKESDKSTDDILSLEYSKLDLESGFYLFNKEEIIVQDKNYTTDITTEIMEEAKNIYNEKKQLTTSSASTNNTISQEKKQHSTVISKNIFIVHGHDNAMKHEVARFIKQLELSPIILHEQANEGSTIIEKIEKHTDVNFAIVLYSDDDVGNKNDNSKNENLNFRARQNVVFEHGYLIAKIGRKNVCALVKSNIEKPSDIDGIVYIDFNNNDWKQKLSQELQNAKYNIDWNKIYRN